MYFSRGAFVSDDYMDSCFITRRIRGVQTVNYELVQRFEQQRESNIKRLFTENIMSYLVKALNELNYLYARSKELNSSISSEVIFKYAQLLAYQGRIEEAEEILDSHEHEFDKSKLYKAYFFYHLGREDVPSAVEIAKKCISEFPQAWFVKTALFIEEFVKRGYFQEANEILVELYQSQVELYDDSLQKIAFLYVQLGRGQDAIDILKAVPLKKDPEKKGAPEDYAPITALLLADIAKELVAQGRVDEAIELANLVPERSVLVKMTDNLLRHYRIKENEAEELASYDFRPYRIVVLSKIAPILLNSSSPEYREKGQRIIDELRKDEIIEMLEDKGIRNPKKFPYPHSHYRYMTGVWAEAMFEAGEYETVARLVIQDLSPSRSDLKQIVEQVGYNEDVKKLLRAVVILGGELIPQRIFPEEHSKVDNQCYVCRRLLTWVYENGDRETAEYINNYLDYIAREEKLTKEERNIWIRVKLEALKYLQKDKADLIEEYKQIEEDEEVRESFLSGLDKIDEKRDRAFPADREEIKPRKFYEGTYSSRFKLEEVDKVFQHFYSVLDNIMEKEYDSDSQFKVKERFSEIVEECDRYVSKYPWILSNITIERLLERNEVHSMIVDELGVDRARSFMQALIRETGHNAYFAYVTIPNLLSLDKEIKVEETIKYFAALTPLAKEFGISVLNLYLSFTNLVKEGISLDESLKLIQGITAEVEDVEITFLSSIFSPEYREFLKFISALKKAGIESSHILDIIIKISSKENSTYIVKQFTKLGKSFLYQEGLDKELITEIFIKLSDKENTAGIAKDLVDTGASEEFAKLNNQLSLAMVSKSSIDDIIVVLSCRSDGAKVARLFLQLSKSFSHAGVFPRMFYIEGKLWNKFLGDLLIEFSTKEEAANIAKSLIETDAAGAFSKLAISLLRIGIPDVSVEKILFNLATRKDATNAASRLSELSDAFYQAGVFSEPREKESDRKGKNGNCEAVIIKYFFHLSTRENAASIAKNLVEQDAAKIFSELTKNFREAEIGWDYIGEIFINLSDEENATSIAKKLTEEGVADVFSKLIKRLLWIGVPGYSVKRNIGDLSTREDAVDRATQCLNFIKYSSQIELDSHIRRNFAIAILNNRLEFNLVKKLVNFFLSENNEIMQEEKKSFVYHLLNKGFDFGVFTLIVNFANQNITHDYKLSFYRSINALFFHKTIIASDSLEDWQLLLSDYVERFGYLCSRDMVLVHRHLSHGEALESDNLSEYQLKNLGITSTGKTGLGEIERVINNVRKKILDEEDIDEGNLDNPLVKAVVGQVTGFYTAVWGHGSRRSMDLKVFTEDFHKAVEKGDIPTLDQHYQKTGPLTFVVRRRGKIRATQETETVFEKYCLLFNIVKGLFGQSVNRQIRYVRQEMEGIINEKIGKLREVFEEIPEETAQKFIQPQIDKLNKLKNVLQEKFSSLLELAVAVVEIMDGEIDLLEHPLALAIITQTFNEHPNINQIMEELEEGASIRTLARIMEIRNTFIKDHTLKEVDKKARKSLLNLLDVGEFEDVLSRVKAIENGAVEVIAFPTKGILGEMAGDIGDACYTAQELIMGLKHLAAVIFTIGEGLDKKFAGSMLILENSVNGKPVFIMRAINPSEEFINEYSPESFLKNVIGYIEEIAEAKGGFVVAPVKYTGALTNRRGSIDTAIKEFVVDGETVSLDKKENFNGYDITNRCVKVSSTPLSPIE